MKLETICGSISVGAIVLLVYFWGKYARGGPRRAERQRQIIQEQKKAEALKYIQRPLEIIEESVEIINKTPNLKTMIHRFETIMSTIGDIETMLRHFQQPDSILSPSPTQLRSRFIEEKQTKVRDFLVKEADRNIERAEAVTRKSSKISILDKTILMLVDGRNELENETEKKRIEEIEESIRALIGALG